MVVQRSLARLPDCWKRASTRATVSILPGGPVGRPAAWRRDCLHSAHPEGMLHCSSATPPPIRLPRSQPYSLLIAGGCYLRRISLVQVRPNRIQPAAASAAVVLPLRVSMQSRRRRPGQRRHGVSFVKMWDITLTECARSIRGFKIKLSEISAAFRTDQNMQTCIQCFVVLFLPRDARSASAVLLSQVVRPSVCP